MMFDEIIKRAEKATAKIEKRVDIRMDGLEAKIDAISVEIAEIKSMVQKLQ